MTNKRTRGGNRSNYHYRVHDGKETKYFVTLSDVLKEYGIKRSSANKKIKGLKTKVFPELTIVKDVRSRSILEVDHNLPRDVLSKYKGMKIR